MTAPAERWVERASDPGSMTGKVRGASPDGAQLAVLWSDGVLRVEAASDLVDYDPAAAAAAYEATRAAELADAADHATAARRAAELALAEVEAVAGPMTHRQRDAFVSLLQRSVYMATRGGR